MKDMNASAAFHYIDLISSVNMSLQWKFTVFSKYSIASPRPALPRLLLIWK